MVEGVTDLEEAVTKVLTKVNAMDHVDATITNRTNCNITTEIEMVKQVLVEKCCAI